MRRREPVDFLVMLLLVVAFLLGPLKLIGASWLSYLAPDAIALVVLLIVFGKRIASRRPLISRSPLSIPIFLLVAFCVLELANPEAPFIRSVLGLRSWVLYLSFYFIGLYALRSVEQLEHLCVLLLTLGSLTAVYGVYQWQTGPESFAGWSDYYGKYAALAWSARSGGVVFRAFSTFVAAGTFGGNMALVMMLAFGVAVSPRVSAQWRILAAAAFITMGAGIAASGSRGPVVHLLLAAGIALLLIQGVRPRLTAALAAIVLVGAAFLLVAFLIGAVVGERFSTIFDPQVFIGKWFAPFTDGLRYAQSHPFGMGLGFTAGVPRFISNPTLRDLPFTSVDSGYGSAAAELGFLGLGLFTFLAVKLGVESFRTWKGLPGGVLKDLLLGPALMATTYPIVSLNFQPQATLPSSIYFWLLIGILMKAPTLVQEQYRAGELRQVIPGGLPDRG